MRIKTQNQLKWNTVVGQGGIKYRRYNMESE